MNKAEEYYDSGVEKANSRNYKEAIKEFDKATKINPKDANAHYNRGLAKGYLGDDKGEIEDYNNAS